MIFCCGEALIDMIPDGAGRYQPHPGGAVFNTARALGRLGAPVGFISGVSRDSFGDMLVDALGQAQVDTTGLIRSDRLTTLALVTLKAGEANYAFYDENSAGRMVRAADLPTLPAAATCLFFGGISLVENPAADAYAALLARECANRVIMIDPNIRPGFIRDETAYRQRISRMIAKADILKLSETDQSWLSGATDPRNLFDETALSAILLTRGGDGVRVLTRRDTLDLPAQRVKVVDTVGAGDSFNAGVLARLHSDGLLVKSALQHATADDLRPAVDYGTRVAAIVVGRAGADAPSAEEVNTCGL